MCRAVLPGAHSIDTPAHDAQPGPRQTSSDHARPPTDTLGTVQSWCPLPAVVVWLVGAGWVSLQGHRASGGAGSCQSSIEHPSMRWGAWAPYPRTDEGTPAGRPIYGSQDMNCSVLFCFGVTRSGLPRDMCLAVR